ncbi:MAG TPA: helix-turn-helix domain-containing protein [Rudaea sp.]|nr:helix-turn-helix domain-containing protein [Rudaea sp.]
MAKSKSGPKALLDEANALRDKANDLEEQAFRAALEQCNWFEARAAELLGVNRSTFKQAISRRYTKLGAEAAHRRKQAGYAGGNPHLPKK